MGKGNIFAITKNETDKLQEQFAK